MHKGWTAKRALAALSMYGLRPTAYGAATGRTLRILQLDVHTRGASLAFVDVDFALRQMDAFAWPTEVLVTVVAQIIERLSRSQSKAPHTTKFSAASPPAVTVADYLGRLCKYLPLTRDAIVLVLLYIRRIALNGERECTCSTAHYLQSPAHRPPGLNVWTVHRLCFGCCVVASKVGPSRGILLS
jgi:hypothetical protein